MNIQEYISSGILEAYVLGELPPAEAAEVEQLARDHQEIREEISRVELTLEKMAFATAVEPDANVKRNLFDTIEEEAAPTDKKVIPMPAPSYGPASYMKYVAAASILVAMVCAVLAYSYWSRWKAVQTELSTLIARNQQIAEDYNNVNQKLDALEQNYNIINDAAYQRVALKGTENAPDARAYIYWDPSSENVYLSIRQLKALSQEKQYQLWAIIDGKPVDAGVFDGDTKGLLKMKNIASASAFAVTIEPKGGSANPSLETMQMMGAVEAGSPG